jgi:hypothetical protein
MGKRWRIETTHPEGKPAAFQLQLWCAADGPTPLWVVALRGLVRQVHGEPIYQPMGDQLVLEGDLDAQALKAIDRYLRPVPITRANELADRLRTLLATLRAEGYPVSSHL